jgi:hypothetical protein
MKRIIIFILSLLISLIGYLFFEWKGVILFLFIFISASFFSEVFFWRSARKKGKKDLIDIIIDKLKNCPQPRI